jgi:hypothetical protein
MSMELTDARRLVERQLADLSRDLEQIHSAVTVAVAALRQQASGIDEDIAHVLQRGAADRIQDQIERAEAVLAALPECRMNTTIPD